MDGVSEENLKKFVDPVFMAKYYTDDSRESVKRIGYSVDWRREFNTTSLYPTFSKFVEWQTERLREKDYIIKGTYPPKSIGQRLSVDRKELHAGCHALCEGCGRGVDHRIRQPASQRHQRQRSVP